MTPEDKENLIEGYKNFLRGCFGGLDFWQLNKKWKEKVYTDAAKMIVSDIEWLIAEKVKENATINTHIN